MRRRLLLPLAAAAAVLVLIGAASAALLIADGDGDSRSASPGAAAATRAEPSSTTEEQRLLGVIADAVTPALRQQYGLREDRGLVIIHVEPGSGAALAALQRGDQLLALNGNRLATPDDLTRLLEASSEASVRVTYLRGAEERTATVSIIEMPSRSVPRAPSGQNGGIGFGVVRQANSSTLILTPSGSTTEQRFSLNGQTEVRRGTTPIRPSDLSVGESVVVFSFDGETAFGVLAFGVMEALPRLR
jgi:membrane-associated protease RseP (regulator of RpoE activity)